MISNNLFKIQNSESLNFKSLRYTWENNISDYSSKSTYEDNVWILDKYYRQHNVSNSLRKYIFSKWPSIEESLDVKSYIYVCILNNMSLEGMRKIFSILFQFSNEIWKQFKIDSYKNINNIHINYYYNKLLSNNLTEKTKFERWNAIKHFFEFHRVFSIVEKMNFYDLKYPEYKMNDIKYISDYVTGQLDKIMLKESEPLKYRLLYWILRMYPCRCTEVLSTPINCLKPYESDTFIFSSLVFKTSGGDEKGTPKLLLLDSNEKMQKYLIDMIREQQEVAKAICKDKLRLGDFLFMSYETRYVKLRYIYGNKPLLVKCSAFNQYLKLVIDRYDIRDEDGSIAVVTSHMFRHNAITDRIESKLFRPIDLRPMTLHANEEMVSKAYHHKSQESIIKQTEAIRKVLTNETVLFSGKVIGSKNDAAFDYFLRNPFAYSLKDMGICADIRECDKSKFECLACDYFIPNCADLDYFENQLADWKKKLDISIKVKNKYMEENSSYNIELFSKVIQKIYKKLEDID